jgi:hypothetical protein
VTRVKPFVSLPLARVLGLSLLGVACAAAPRPRVLSEVDRARTAPASEVAKQRAPQAFARADALFRRAEAAHAEGDAASSQILGERALAAYQRAVTLAALAAAEARVTQADASLAKVERDLAGTTETQAKLDAELRALELRLKVARETLPVPASGPPSSPERELARREAAQALVTQARLLCVASRLLAPSQDSRKDVEQKLGELAARLPTAPMAPLDEARAARTACLKELAVARRARTQADPVSPTADRLLTELARAAHLPSRDDRGVVVTVERPFDASDQLSKGALSKLTELAAIAKAHPEFPLLVVVHAAARLPTARETARAERAATALREHGAPSVAAESANNALPELDRRQPGASAKNDRVEVVFVAPSAT